MSRRSQSFENMRLCADARRGFACLAQWDRMVNTLPASCPHDVAFRGALALRSGPCQSSTARRQQAARMICMNSTRSSPEAEYALIAIVRPWQSLLAETPSVAVPSGDPTPAH
ncbi:hypothetical protein L1887_50683 [Cichorium endivia]|nr:hypothetical protein L1887_50683 [Cichorium endivia]